MNNMTSSQLIFDNPLLDSILKQASEDAMKKLEVLQKSKINQVKQSNLNYREENNDKNIQYFLDKNQVKIADYAKDIALNDDFTQKYFKDQYGKMIPSNFKTPNAFSLPESQSFTEDHTYIINDKDLISLINNRKIEIERDNLFIKFTFNKWLMAFVVIKNEKISKNKKVVYNELMDFFNEYVISQSLVANKDFIIICEILNAKFLDFLTILSIKDIKEEESEIILYTNTNTMKNIDNEFKKGVVMILKNAKIINFIEKKIFLIENSNQFKIIS